MNAVSEKELPEIHICRWHKDSTLWTYKSSVPAMPDQKFMLIISVSVRGVFLLGLGRFFWSLILHKSNLIFKPYVADSIHRRVKSSFSVVASPCAITGTFTLTLKCHCGKMALWMSAKQVIFQILDMAEGGNTVPGLHTSR